MFEFDFKICRACGDRFQGSDVICDSCIDRFNQLTAKLKESEYKDHLSYCKYCHRPFIKGQIVQRKGKSYFQVTSSVYCKEIHYSQCQNCGSAIKVDLSSGWPNKVGCSRKCTSEVQKVRLRATSLERYGTENPMQSKELQLKTQQTCLDRYGVTHVLARGPMRDKINEAMKTKFNVESNVSQNPEVQAKARKTYRTNYIENTENARKLLDKRKATSLVKYGTEFPHQSDEVKQKIHEGLILRRANSIEDECKRQNYLDFISDPIKYVTEHFECKPTFTVLQDSIGGLDGSSVYDYLGPGACSEYLSHVRTTMEEQIYQFILSISDTTIATHNRSIIRPKELDLYLPEYDFAIECNPTATHNSSLHYKDDIESELISKDYHKIKTDECESQGVFLFHIFGYEWKYKQEIIKSMIQNRLGKSNIRYYARKLSVKEISSDESKYFLTKNHRQGYTNASVRLALVTSDDEIVSVMTFNKMRNTMGKTSEDTDITWELSRYCSNLYTSVVGGASKLFTYFISNYCFDKIVSFSDRAHTTGLIYETLRFQKVSSSAPNYVWVNYRDDTYFNRVSCQKRNLPKLFNEPNLDIENQTEKQIMMSHGYVQVFDSGTIRWEYRKEDFNEA